MSSTTAIGDAPPDAAVAAALNAMLTPYDYGAWRAELEATGEGTPTGFDALDALGMRDTPGTITGAVGRPGRGKTAFLLEKARRHVAGGAERRVVFLSWELSRAPLVTRLLVAADGVQTSPSGGTGFGVRTLYLSTVEKYGRGEPLDEHYTTRLDTAGNALWPLLASGQLRIVDGDAVSSGIDDVAAAIAALVRAEPVTLVLVDYFQKLRGDVPTSASRQQELQHVSETLRLLAKGAALHEGSTVPDPRYAVPITVAAQVTRGEDAAAHPTGDRIRESDDLLNDASTILALSAERLGFPGDDELRTLRISVPKHRSGVARPDEVCQFHWRPARGWISPGAIRHEDDRVQWTPVEQLKSGGGAPEARAEDPLDRECKAESRRAARAGRQKPRLGVVE